MPTGMGRFVLGGVCMEAIQVSRSGLARLLGKRKRTQKKIAKVVAEKRGWKQKISP